MTSPTRRLPPRCSTNFTQWVGETPVVAHNVAFDLPFVFRHLPNDVKWAPSAVFDTLELGYQLYPDAGAWKLADLVRFVFGRDHAAAHRAMPDAEAAAELFIHFTSGLAERLDALRERHRRRGAPRARELQPVRAGRSDGGHPAPPRHRLALMDVADQGDRA